MVTNNIIVFDIGGTLMSYNGMTNCWVNYYKIGFERINEKFQCHMPVSEIRKSVDILKKYNPRINYREVEYKPQHIFTEALKNWNLKSSLVEAINIFYHGLNLQPQIFDDTIPAILYLKKKGYKIAALTDLPTAMPDSYFKRHIFKLLNYFDMYVSSLSCGYRKPNAKGLELIAQNFKVPIENILFVGDEEKDRQTAINAGCKFILINRNKRTDESIYDLSELCHNIKLDLNRKICF